MEQVTPAAPERRSWLDEPLIPGVRVERWMAIYIAIMAVIAFTRLWDLGGRSYDHDESIHVWESWKLLTGRGYIHSPVYHGPFLYHFTAFVFALFGDNNVTGRLATALAGIAITAMPLTMRRWLGKTGVLAVTALMAVSPTLMHRARFIRHDQFSILFNLILLVSCLHYLEDRKPGRLYWVAAMLALGFAGKETTFITYAIFGSFLGGLLLWQWARGRDWRLETLRALPVFDLVVVIGTLILPFASPVVIQVLGRDPLDYTSSGVLVSLGISLVMAGIGAGIGLWWNPRRWLGCAALFWGLFLPLFTSMFTNGNGIVTGVVGQLGYWLSQHGESRGGQPWHYYLVIAAVYEFLPLVLAVGTMLYHAIKGDPRVREDGDSGPRAVPFTLLMIYWLIMAALVYSWAGEKMPWLMQHISVPMTLVAGLGLARILKTDWRAIQTRQGLWLLALVPLLLYTLVRMGTLRPSMDTTTESLSMTILWVTAVAMGLALAWVIGSLLARLRRGDAWRMLSLSLLGVLLLFTVRAALRATYTNADSAAELLVYAQAAPDAGILARELDAMSERLTGGLHMKVAYDNETSWPFVWYLRNYDNATFFGEAPTGPLDADVVLVGTENEGATKPFLGNGYVRREYRLIWWPYQDWYMSMTPASLWHDLTDPVARRALWDVLFYRKWDRALTDWPYVTRVAAYFRRDVLQMMWEGSPDALAALEPAEPDPYLEAWQTLTAARAVGSAGAGQGQLAQPKGVAVDADGNLYVADSQNHRVQVYDALGNAVQSWGGEGAGAGQFQEPWGIAVGPDGTVYVADTWNHRIQAFTGQGEFLYTWGRFGEAGPDGPGELLYGPRGVAVDSAGNIYVTDTGNKRVIKYDPLGQVLGVVGGAGTDIGQFQEPVGIAIGADGHVHVADTWNHRIQVLTSGLEPLDSWEVSGWQGASVINKPYLAIDASGTVWTSDPESHRVIGFGSEGEVLTVFGQYGATLNGMNIPAGLAALPDGSLYVADSENGRVLLFANPAGAE